MNRLEIGIAETPFEYPQGSLVITDDQTPKRGEVLFDYSEHGLSPLPLKYPMNREFAAALWPDKDLMTYRNGQMALADHVVKADRLDHIKYTTSDDDKEVRRVVKNVLLSPLLKKMLRKPIPRWLNSGSTVLARLNRKEIGDFDAQIIANILMLVFKGPVAIEDFGGYARDHHARLIREGRLIARVRKLSQLPEKIEDVRHLMENVPIGCSYDDAVKLASEARLKPDPDRKNNDYNEFIKTAMV
jgi:hypothetical protein